MRHELRSIIRNAVRDAGKDHDDAPLDVLAAEAIRLAQVATGVHRFEAARRAGTRKPDDAAAETAEVSR